MYAHMSMQADMYMHVQGHDTDRIILAHTAK